MKTNGNDIAIKLTDVSKRFKLYHNPITGPVKEILFYWNRKQYYEEFMAVKNVSMEIKRGEVVGIIGPNGAGKTTLLKMIAGLLPIDGGKIEINGKVTALLALGVGVHPEFTGKENILYGGMLLGMSKREVLAKMDGIIEFAELGDYINRPFRTYSSGMKARLLFAISMSIDPDILIVDEALATGDSYFLSKSRKRILELCNSGATILFVSHNLSQIQELCSRVYFMADGEVMATGCAGEAISSYNSYVFSSNTSKTREANENNLFMSNGTGDITVNKIKLENLSRDNTEHFYTGDSIKIEIFYESSLPNETFVDLFIGILQANNSLYVSEFNSANFIDENTRSIKKHKILIKSQSKISVTLPKLLLLNNTYGLWIIFYKDNAIFCEYKNIYHFFVARENNAIMASDAFFWHPGEFKEE